MKGEEIISPLGPLPPTISVVTLGDRVFDFKLNTGTSRSVTASIVFGLALWAASGIALLLTINRHFDMGELWNWPLLVREIGLSVLALGLPALLLAYLSIKPWPGRIMFDGATLAFKTLTKRFEFPATEILRIDCAVYEKQALRADPRQPITRLFRRRPVAGLEVEIDEGRLRFFDCHEPAELQWLATTIAALLSLPATETLVKRPRDDPHTAVVGRSTRTERRISHAMLAIALILTAAACNAMLVPAWQSNRWPATTGRVIESKYEVTKTSDHETRQSSTIRYRYTVDGNDFESDRIGFGMLDEFVSSRDFVLAHPKDSDVQVSYNPSDPAQSTLVRGVGRLLWAIPCIGGFFVLLAIPAFFERSSIKQDALIRKYKVLPRKRGLDDPYIVRWWTPEAVFHAARAEAGPAATWSVVRMWTATNLGIGLIWFLTLRVGANLPWWRMTLSLNGMLAPYLAMVLFAGWRRGKPAEFRLTGEGVVRTNAEHPLLPWERICSFEIEEVPAEPTHRNLVLHRKQNYPRTIPLPGDDNDDLIIGTLRERLPQGPPLDPFNPLTHRDFLASVALTIGYVVVASWIFASPSGGSDPRKFSGVAMLIILLCGPGTLFAILRRGRSRAQRFSAAVLLNCFAWMAILVSVAFTRLPA